MRWDTTRKAQPVAQSAWELVKPDVWVIGETHGQPPWLAGGNFALISFADGSVTYFGSKPLSGVHANPFHLPGGGRFGIVGTVGPNGQELGPGFAGKVPTPLGDFLIWANVRQDGLTAQSLQRKIQQTRDNPGSQFTVSINLGAAYSVSDGALLGFMAATGGSGTALKLGADAAGVDAWLGVGYRASVTFKNGQIDHFNISGVKIRPDELGSFLADQAQRPQAPIVPNGGSSRVASLNDTALALFGQSPWDIGHSAILRTSGEVVIGPNGGVDVRNHGNAIVAVTEPIYELATESGLLAPGARIRDNAHAAWLIEALYQQRAGDPAAQGALTARLLNPYHLTFGAPSLDMAQRMFHGNGLMQAMVNLERSGLGLSPLGGKPADYDFVRSVFQGDYRWQGDNPPRDSGLGGRRGL
jgi:hypothetical protein